MAFGGIFGKLETKLTVISALETYYSNRINRKLVTVGSSSFMWKILHLPMEFFSQRLAGDIQGRQSSNAGIANSVVNTFAPLALNAIMMVFYLVVMIRYSWILTLVGLSSLVINAWMSNIQEAHQYHPRFDA